MIASTIVQVGCFWRVNTTAPFVITVGVNFI